MEHGTGFEIKGNFVLYWWKKSRRKIKSGRKIAEKREEYARGENEKRRHVFWQGQRVPMRNSASCEFSSSVDVTKRPTVNCEHFISKNLNFKRALSRVLADGSARTADELGVLCTCQNTAYRPCPAQDEKLVLDSRPRPSDSLFVE